MSWDRTRSWVIECREVGRARIHVHFEALPITLSQMAAVRRTFPEFAKARPDEIRARISATGDLEIGEYGFIEANFVERAAREAGLTAVLTNTTYNETVIIDQASGDMLLIEDEGEHARTVQEMIEAGVKVQYFATD